MLDRRTELTLLPISSCNGYTTQLIIWYFGELPDPVRIVLDCNYADADEASDPSREAALNALAVTLGNFFNAANLPSQ